MVTCILEHSEKFGWDTHMVRVNDEIVAGITDQTPIEAVNKFVELCKQYETELDFLLKAAEEKRKWNHAQPYGQGRNWPEFGKLERLKAQLCKQAGIIDS